MNAPVSLTPPPAGALRITDLDEAWKTAPSRGQLRALRSAAERLRERFARGPRVIAVRTLPLATLPYATKHAFGGALAGPLPFCILTLRATLVQFFQGGEVKSLLFAACDVEAAQKAPYLATTMTRIGRRIADIGSRRFDALESQLTTLGLAASDIDFLAFNDFQFQDVRHLVGAGAAVPRFPNAVLLAPKCEWEDWADLPPLQRAWYVPSGNAGVDESRVLLTTSDVLLGDGAMLLRTPGRTSGHQTLFLHTDTGVWGISANGVCADSWSPMESKNRGLRTLARDMDVEVVTGAGAENARNQYASMVLERTLADRVTRAPGFVQMFPMAELIPSPLTPGIAPTLMHRALTSGTLAGRA